ncbi:MAG: hypothetical protein L3J96_06200, partial [Thermoplasmata archaeon]|nr:hypothetical protein [Thermoplasmata archaeon]
DRLSYDFPISVDLSATYVQTSGTVGGYPQSGNFTTTMLNTYQEWNELHSISLSGAPGTTTLARSTIDDQLAGASGVFGGTEDRSGPNAATITGITFVTSSTDKQYTTSSGPPSAPTTYSHLLVASSYQPPQPYEVETVTTDSVRNILPPLALQVVATPSALDEGDPVSFAAIGAGGVAPYSYSWSGLPTGCAPANSSIVACTPAAAGAYSVGAQLTDGLGDVTAPTVTSVVVANPLAALVLPANRSVDVGGTDLVSVAVTGGFPPYSCQWFIANISRGPAGACDVAIPFTPTTPGGTNVSVLVTDGTGRSVWGANLTLVVGSTVTVQLSASSTNSTVFVGNTTVLSADVVGGSAPFSYVWLLNGAIMSGASGGNYTFVPTTPGSYLFNVKVVDSAGVQSASNAITVTVVSVPSSTGTSSSGSGGSDTFMWLAYALAAAAIIELALLVVLLTRRTPPRGTRPRGPPRRPPP